MPDEIIKELWETKDSIAHAHGYDVEALVAHLQAKERPKGQRIVDLREKREAEQRASSDADKLRR